MITNLKQAGCSKLLLLASSESFLNMSLDQPFGVNLHSYFETAYEAVVGKKASSFRYIQGQTPLSENSTGTCQTWNIVYNDRWPDMKDNMT